MAEALELLEDETVEVEASITVLVMVRVVAPAMFEGGMDHCAEVGKKENTTFVAHAASTFELESTDLLARRLMA